MIGRLNHIAIAVPDLESAAKVYRDTLGATVSDPLDQPEHGGRIVRSTWSNGPVLVSHGVRQMGRGEAPLHHGRE